MLGGTWSRVRDVPVAVLAGLSLAALMAILLAENRRPGDDPEALFAVLDARSDDVAAIADAARALGTATGAERLLREVLLAWALRRLQRAWGPQRFEQCTQARGVVARTWLEAFGDVVREHGGASEPVYVLELDHGLSGVSSPRSSASWSVVGGDGPGVARRGATATRWRTS
jgi:hypothetical protein